MNILSKSAIDPTPHLASAPTKLAAQEKIKGAVAIGISKHHSRLGSQAIYSVGTLRNYTSCIASFLQWRQTHLGIAANQVIFTQEAEFFLGELSLYLAQASLNAYQRALELAIGAKLTKHESDIALIAKSRALNAAELAKIIGHMSKKYALATLVIANAGLRASEIYELRFTDELAPSTHRQWNEDRFTGRGDVVPMVIENGKGGLHRPVALHPECFAQLMEYKLPHKKLVIDRGVCRYTWFDLPAGQKLSQAFSDASNRALSSSNGIHGLRHSYVQARYAVLSSMNLSHAQALAIITQEMGHFRSDITVGYFA